jgi:uncharacterized protein YciI
MLFVIHAIDKPGNSDVRMKTRAAHLDYLSAAGEQVVVAGPTLTEDGVGMTGSVLIIEAADRAGAEAFARNDPYAKAGLFQNTTIMPWRKVFFHPPRDALR